MHDLIEKMFVATFGQHDPKRMHDSVLLDCPKGKLAMTTDSFVVHPYFFPGGDIGSLSVHGTVNDLAMSGARPLYLSVGMILEEGLAMENLWRIVQSMKQAADAAGVRIVTGDTKVVDKGKGDGIFINTTGIGVVAEGMEISPQKVCDGDVIIVNGDLGRHGMAVMAVREGLEFESEIVSDSADLSGMVQDLIAAKVDLHCLRDLTRGGLSSTMNEIAESRGCQIYLEEMQVPVQEDVRGACEMLGLDPFYVACEGRCAIFVSEQDQDHVLRILGNHPVGQGASVIGRVQQSDSARVFLKNQIGTQRILDMLSGEQLPRIC